MQLFDHLARDLAGGGVMAGSDPTGRQWSRRYVPAARSAVRAVADALHPLASAGAASNVVGRVGGWPPSDACGQADPPAAWELVARVAGSAWPDGRPDVLRAAAQVWETSAALLQQAGCSASAAAVAARWQTLFRAHQTLGSACRGLADDLDRVHASIAAALTSHGLDARRTRRTALPQQVAISYTARDGPVQTAVGWHIAAAAVQVTGAVRAFAAAADERASTLPFVGDLCADVSRLAIPA